MEFNNKYRIEKVLSKEKGLQDSKKFAFGWINDGYLYAGDRHKVVKIKVDAPIEEEKKPISNRVFKIIRTLTRPKSDYIIKVEDSQNTAMYQNYSSTVQTPQNLEMPKHKETIETSLKAVNKTTRIALNPRFLWDIAQAVDSKDYLELIIAVDEPSKVISIRTKDENDEAYLMPIALKV